MIRGRAFDLSGKLLIAYAVFFVFLTYGPILLIPLFSFNDGIYVAFPIESFTGKWYTAMLNDASLGKALWTSLRVGFAASILATSIALLAAMALTRYRLGLATPTKALILSPMIIPVLVLGVANLALLALVLGLKLGLWTIVAGHVLVCLPYAFLVLMARLEGFDQSLMEASADLGENGWMTFWRVTVPIAMPGIVSSLLTSFSTSFDEFVITSFLSQSDQTLPILIYSRLRFPDQLPVTLALGASMLALSILLLLIAEWFRRRGATPRARLATA